MPFYAWTPIKAGDKSAAYGDTITPAKLGISKEQFEAHVESGAFRAIKPPDLPETWRGSPIDFLKAQIADEAESSLTLAEALQEEEEE